MTPHLAHFRQTHLQEAVGVMVTALQEPGLLPLHQEAGNVARDANVQAIHDSQQQLRPAGGDTNVMSHPDDVTVT